LVGFEAVVVEFGKVQGVRAAVKKGRASLGVRVTRERITARISAGFRSAVAMGKESLTCGPCLLAAEGARALWTKGERAEGTEPW
jgi:hypothetical protein